MDKKLLTRIFLTTLGLIISIGILVHLYYSFLPEIKLLFDFTPHNQALFLKLLRHHGITDMFFMFIVTMLFAATPGMSNAILSVLNGIVYGPYLGFLINWLSVFCGQFLLLILMNKISRKEDFKASHYLNLIVNFPYPTLALIICYCTPFIPNITVNYANINLIKSNKRQAMIILIGSIPMAIVYAFGGDAILHLNIHRIIHLVIIFIIFSVLAFAILTLIKKVRNKKDLEY